MNSKFYLLLLAAVILEAALPLCVPAAPLQDAPTNLPPEEISGEKEEEDQRTTPRPNAFNIINIWEQVLSSTNTHKKQFETEFGSNVEYVLLNRYKPPSLPDKRPNSTSSKEACFQWLVQGLTDYKVLLKFVAKEYPSTSIVAKVNAAIPLMMAHIKAKMRNADSVVAPTSSEEQQWLKKLDNPDLFHRKMMAHSILRSLNFFLVDGKRLYIKWEMPKGKPQN